jgi:hypothetical protein
VFEALWNYPKSCNRSENRPLIYGVENPLAIQSLEKDRRNYILKSTKDFGAGIRQLSRLTGVSYGIIQKL